MADAKIEDFNFINEKSHVYKIYSFQFFVDFSTDLDRPANKHFRTDFTHTYLYIDMKILKPSFSVGTNQALGQMFQKVNF